MDPQPDSLDDLLDHIHKEIIEIIQQAIDDYKDNPRPTSSFE
jgi:hypothetical protein